MSHHIHRTASSLIAGLGLTVLAGAGLAASAAPVVPSFVTSTAAKGMVYTGSTAHTDTTFTLSGSTFLVTDTGPIKAGVGCNAVAGNPNAARCVAPKDANGVFKRFQASGSGGNDYLLNNTPVGMVGFGGSGEDSLVGSVTAPDELDGGSERDQVTGRGGNDRLFGGDGDDRIRGGLDADIIVGGLGADSLRGGDGNDRFLSGAQNDGADEIYGDGGASDEVDYTNRSRDINVTLTNPEGRFSGEAGEQDRITEVENAAGSLQAPNSLIGNEFANQLVGGAGKDFIVGGPGADRLVGNGGDDSLFSGGLFPDPIADQARDTALGGFGVDRCFVAVSDGDIANSCEL